MKTLGRTEKTLALAILLFFFAATLVQCKKEEESLVNWRENLGLGKEKVSRLHFFFHDTLSGKNPTAVTIAQAAMTKTSPTRFGAVNMADDPLTEGPELTSKLVGRAQGFYASAGQQEVCLLMAMSYLLTEGKYKGSSLSILGRNHALDPVRELPVIGGSGLFRLARGYAVAKTHRLNKTSGDAIIEYHVTVIHY
uniref:Dirigent protein n=1 Tax=Kadsura heteroclita TaxID=124781 RepID=A0A7U3W2C2_9MAGN|nr:dirigent protein 22 [Kadsura heteroclita]